LEDLYYNINSQQIIYCDNNCIQLNKFINPLFFDTEEFHQYHQKFAEKVYRIFFCNNNKQIAYCYIGLKNGIMKAPYSSPFSMVYVKNKYRINQICSVIKGLIDCAEILKCEKIMFSLPPEIYLPEVINSEWAAFSSNGFKVEKIDINNYFNLLKFQDKELFLKKSIHSLRQNYNIALKNNLIFTEIPIEKFKLAYDVIKINRKEMGYPLKISENQMNDLIHMKELTCRCFGVKKEDNFIAAAIVFDVTKDISQVIYWGDIDKYRKIRPMNMLTVNIFEFYRNLGKKYLDIGPSSENGVINNGLADFKKSIGCDNNIKITFKYEL